MNKLDLIIDRLELIEKFDWNTLVVKGSVHEALAAARELREVNQELVEALQNLCRAADNGHVANYSNLWDEARTAIAKATGEST